MSLNVCRRWIRVTIGIGILAAGVLGAEATSAAADASIVDLTCPGYSQTTYQPGMTDAARQITISGSGVYGPCVSSDPTLTSGTFHASGTGIVSCVSGSFSGSITFIWNNGRSSTVSYTAIIGQHVDGEVVVVVHGTVTDGEFEGDTFIHTVTLFTLEPPQCFTSSGVASTSGPKLITFTQPL